MTKKLISVICPVYNEEKSIPIFYDRLMTVITPLEETYEFELIFTNNCSQDGTRDVVLKLHEQEENVHLITLSRNFGYQASVLCGLTLAQGAATIVIDVDCEDPPEMIADFLRCWEDGYDVVYGIRNKRMESPVVQFMRTLFYWLLQKLADNETVMHMAEFALIDRRVRQEIISNKSTFPFLRTEIGYAGFKRLGLPYLRQQRLQGKSHYNFLGMTVFAIGGILSSSTYLLRAAAYSAIILLPLNFVLLILEMGDIWGRAFEMLVSLDLMYIIFFLAVLSVYTARIYKNGVQRPTFIVDWKLSTYARAAVGPSFSSNP
ncbi:MAG TPA: glycosyltransferase family 2 protein [Phototrophicaceae bacterium]|nr:glycosyltransferase family 2 protein [Phototrophicaceae bacterium]